MLEAALRQAATGVLETAIRVAPPDVRDWGRAMLGELGHIDNTWAAIMWALGGAGVLAKHALLSLLIPGRRGHGNLLDGGLFAKNVTLRKVAFVASGVYILGALLFFAAPPFRQGLRVSLASWNALFHVTGQKGQPRLQALAQRAEARHDADGMVFVAARLWNPTEGARLVEEAVRIDPRLLWAYAVVAMRHPELPQIPQWIPKLQQWQPHNALFSMIAAESIYAEHLTNAARPSEAERQRAEVAWRKAMAAAFASPEFDDYLNRLEELNRRVTSRYRLNDPQELLLGEQAGPLTYTFSGAWRYAKSLLQSGESLEARGDRQGAAERYWTVARFGQVMDSQAHANDEHFAGAALQVMAYKQLQALSVSEGNTREAALFAYLGKKLNPATGERARLDEGVFGRNISRRNAAVLQISSLLMLLFSGLLIIAASILIAGKRRREGVRRPGVWVTTAAVAAASGRRSLLSKSRRPEAAATTQKPQFSHRLSRPGAMVLGLLSAMGLLLSSATLYLTYRPYWYMFQDAILKGQTIPAGQPSQTLDLRSFLAATHTLPGIKLYDGQALMFPVYFWTGVIMVGIAGIALILLRHFREPPRFSPAQPNPHVQ